MQLSFKRLKKKMFCGRQELQHQRQKEQDFGTGCSLGA